MKTRANQLIGNRQLCVVALVAAMALLLAPAGANAASPVLEFVVPGGSFPVHFTVESGPVSAEMKGFSSLVHCAASQGEGEITGPSSTVSKYKFTGCKTEVGSHQKCKSVGANEEEITAGPIEADLVYLNRARDEVAMLLNPHGGTYIEFECGGEEAKGTGPFLAPVSPINRKAMSFSAILNQSGSMQTPDEYEGPAGELLKAIPMGERGTHGLVTTGVEATFAVHTSVPVEVKATAQEIEAEQQEEEAVQLEEALLKQEAALKTQEAALRKLEGTLKAAEEHAKKLAEEAKKHEEELNAQIASIKKHQEEEVAAAKKKAEDEKVKSKSSKRNQLLENALKKCKKDKPKSKRMQCERAVEKKYGAKGKKAKG